ncbi:MAG: DNA-processing protein DprA [Candidatus Pacebacteria bacterium]|nr:DNA-processing protein DprA [Candidatus Paceibacterota bacterium]
MEEEKLYWLAFSVFEGIGPKRFALLLKYFGSARAAWQAKRLLLLKTGLNQPLVEKLIKFRRDFDPAAYFQLLKGKAIGLLFLDEDNYPVNLKNTDNPPFILYVRGQILKQDRRALAVVGTRRMSAYGGQACESLTAELASMGLAIVSGLARGIDSVAHKTALAAKGRTIAVLGSGIDFIYPPENKYLAERIVAEGGVLVSEYPLGTKPVLGYFPARNRIIAGLSLGVLVVEGAEKSGSLITARLAAEQGREVFAVPGPIYSPGTRAPAHLIKLGAKLVLSAADVLSELRIDRAVAGRQRKRETSPSVDEEKILSLLTLEPKHLDQLTRESGLTTGEATSLMTMMEIKGMVRDLGGMIYIKTKKIKTGG